MLSQQDIQQVIEGWYSGRVLYSHCVEKLIHNLTDRPTLEDSVQNLTKARLENYITKQEYCLALYDLFQSNN